MDDLEVLQYTFDLQGYIIVENVLSPDEVATFNRLINAQGVPEPGLESDQRLGRAAGSGPEGAGFLNWGQPFVDLSRPCIGESIKKNCNYSGVEPLYGHRF